MKVKYPVKIGFKDESGKDEFWITDKNDQPLVCGWGDCCRIGGIQEKIVADVIVALLNEHRPEITLQDNK